MLKEDNKRWRYWARVLKEVQQNTNGRDECVAIHRPANHKCAVLDVIELCDNAYQPVVQIGLGKKYPKVKLSRREAETLFCFLEDFHIPDIATALDISSKTVEYYLRNIRDKLNLKRRVQMVRAVCNSDFMDNYRQAVKKGLLRDFVALRREQEAKE